MKEYHTRQRKALIGLFKENDTIWFTVDDIMDALGSEAGISRSAIYRNLDHLIDEGLIRKNKTTDSRKPFYQFINCDEDCERVHLRCEKCGKVFHLESIEDENQVKAILQKNGFLLDDETAMLPGTCKDCVK